MTSCKYKSEYSVVVVVVVVVLSIISFTWILHLFLRNDFRANPPARSSRQFMCNSLSD